MFEMDNEPFLTLVRTGLLAGTGQTEWMNLVGHKEHVFVANVENVNAAVGTFICEAQMQFKDGTFGTTQTIYSSTSPADFPQVGRLAGNWRVRMRCSVYTGGQFHLAVTQ